MGYRSAVAYTIRFVPTEDDFIEQHKIEAKKSFYTFLAEAKAKPETALCFNELEPINIKDKAEGFYVDEENMQIDFLAWHVKWYDGYKDVDCHELLFSLANDWADDNDYIGGVKVRIGEELDDNERDEFGVGDSEWLDIGRSIIRNGREI
jgi:hypothetical protein